MAGGWRLVVRGTLAEKGSQVVECDCQGPTPHGDDRQTTERWVVAVLEISMEVRGWQGSQ